MLSNYIAEFDKPNSLLESWRTLQTLSEECTWPKGGCIQTSSKESPFRKHFLTSIQNRNQNIDLTNVKGTGPKMKDLGTHSREWKTLEPWPKDKRLMASSQEWKSIEIYILQYVIIDKTNSYTWLDAGFD